MALSQKLDVQSEFFEHFLPLTQATQRGPPQSTSVSPLFCTESLQVWAERKFSQQIVALKRNKSQNTYCKRYCCTRQYCSRLQLCMSFPQHIWCKIRHRSPHPFRLDFFHRQNKTPLIIGTIIKSYMPIYR